MTSETSSDPGVVRFQMEQLETAVSALLSADTHSEAHLRDRLEAFRPVLAPDMSDDELSAVHRRLVHKLSIDVELGVGITDTDFRSWLPEKKQDIEWTRWLTYKQWLRNNNRSPRVLEKMETFTDSILDYVGDPMLAGPWNRRGLVIGDVQSGKTQTYLGLLNKAADAGYRLIVLLAGNTEYLRQQTQIRVDEGFLGKDSSRNVTRTGTDTRMDRYVGVGRLNKDLTHATGMTTVVQDFLQASRDATSITVSEDSPNPFIFVIKKNVHVLKALIDWTKGQTESHGRINLPLLLVDDESDYASVNTGKEDDPTQTNLLIRQLLGKFSRSSYVAITATPFANILIDHEAKATKEGETHKDLFPKDFIYGLEAPSNYVGSVATFGTEGDVDTSRVINLDDVEDLLPLNHKQAHPLTELPESLRTAIRVFVVANAVRDLRGQGEKARSMLINISRFKTVQGHIYDLVKHELDSIQNALEAHAILYTEGVENDIIDSLQVAFTDFYSETEFTWTDILGALSSAASEITVRTFNSDTDKRLKEQGKSAEIPKRVIAIGGDMLSRGLTLEGLTISYFYRNARAADTMMQMARWFGYRDGFEDICRIWIDRGVAGDYRFISGAVEELREDLDLMRRQQLTPEHFGLAIRMHPGTLLITAKNKSKSAVVRRKSISLIGRRIETSRLDTSADVVTNNRRAAQDLVEDLLRTHGEPKRTRRDYPRFTDVPQSVVGAFLGRYTAHPMDELFFGNAIGKFVRNTKYPRFSSWDVVLVNGARTPGKEHPFGGVMIYPPQRGMTIGSSGELLVSGKSSRLAGGDDLRKTLDAEIDKEVTEKFNENHPGKSLTESPFYASLPRPVLLVYVLDAQLSDTAKAKTEHLQGQHIVGIKVAFPGDRTDVNNRSGDVEYLINTVAQQQWFIEVSDEDADE